MLKDWETHRHVDWHALLFDYVTMFGALWSLKSLFWFWFSGFLFASLNGDGSEPKSMCLFLCVVVLNIRYHVGFHLLFVYFSELRFHAMNWPP